MGKIGEGHAQAWIREGFDEATQALQAFPQDIHPVDEPGLFGTITPGEAARQMGADEMDFDDRVEEQVQNILARTEAEAIVYGREWDEPEMEPPQPEMEM